MKKKYIQPDVNVINVDIKSMILAGSDPQGTVTDTTMGFGGDAEAGDEAGARRGSYWDDYDD